MKKMSSKLPTVMAKTPTDTKIQRPSGAPGPVKSQKMGATINLGKGFDNHEKYMK